MYRCHVYVLVPFVCTGAICMNWCHMYVLAVQYVHLLHKQTLGLCIAGQHMSLASIKPCKDAATEHLWSAHWGCKEGLHLLQQLHKVHGDAHKLHEDAHKLHRDAHRVHGNTQRAR